MSSNQQEIFYKNIGSSAVCKLQVFEKMKEPVVI
jgi:hypothetical protein